MLAYLEIKDFPTDVSPIVKGATQVVSWWRSGELAANSRDALLVATNAAAYGIGMGADFIPQTMGAFPDVDSTPIAHEIESCLSSLSAEDGVPTVAINPLLIIQIAQLVFQLIKSLKS